jgi:hypothetical protein
MKEKQCPVVDFQSKIWPLSLPCPLINQILAKYLESDRLSSKERKVLNSSLCFLEASRLLLDRPHVDVSDSSLKIIRDWGSWEKVLREGLSRMESWVEMLKPASLCS